MAPVRRRVRGTAAGGGGQVSNSQAQREREQREAESDEDAGPSLNIVSLALRYSDEQGEKQRNKANKLLNETRKLANEYTRKVEDAVLMEDKELDTLWKTYAQATLHDNEERKQLLHQLEDNDEQIEGLRMLVHNRSENLEIKRNEANVSHLAREEKRIIASHKALVKTVRIKKTAFNTRNLHPASSANLNKAMKKTQA